MDRIPIINNAVLFDKAIGEIQTSLGGITWLDHIFGKAERLVKIVNNKKYYTPNIYVGANEYEQITPSSIDFGNYAFFTLNEPISVKHGVGEPTELVTQFSLIVWVDMRTIETYDDRNTEAVKQELLRTLNNHTHLRYGHFHIFRIWEKAENIFKGFTLDEVDNQFLMQPYCGWRFDGELMVIDDCENY